jgi:hypothetical protein
MSAGAPSWRIAGSYFESCNCEAICPCRTIAGVPGGRSTYGTCFGLLSWLVEEGFADEVVLNGLAAALVYDYDDDEPGSPWRLHLHVDERGDERQRAALADILLGRAGGERILRLPWVRKASDVLAERTSRIEIAHEGGAHQIRIATIAAARASRRFETDARVSCIVPGHEIAGIELVADVLEVHDDPFEWQLTENCAFAARFDYRSDERRSD